jgi:flagellar hook-associated protein 1 FlgK
MAGNVLNIGVSGLLASQQALAVVSHNISNANTDGYSRQRVNLQARDPENFGFGYVGTGVAIGGIQRIYDEFNTSQLRLATSGSAQAQQFYALASQVDNLVGATDAGIMSAVQAFFNALQDVSNNPGSQVPRQTLLSQANELAARFQYFDQQLNQLRTSSNAQLSATVQEVNGLASSIAEVNRQIINAGAVNGTPNDLLDRRDELIRQLSQDIGVTTAVQGDGSLNVFIGNGQALVVGSESRRLMTIPNAYDPSRLEVAYDVSPKPITISEQLTGGKIGGLLSFRNQMLDPAQNAIGQLAIGLTETFNAQHRQGMDLYGNLGGDFFQSESATVQVLASTRNTGQPSAEVGATIVDAGALTSSDYRLERTSVGYVLTRLTDNKTFSLAGFPASPVTVDGVTLSLRSGAMAVGDSFLIKPTRSGAANIKVAITDPSMIAAAAPLRTQASPGNLGTGQIGEATLVDPGAYTAQAYTLVAIDSNGDGAADGYNVLDSSNTLLASGAYISGGDIEFSGIRVSLSGSLKPGDIFTIAPNTNGSGDNRNALALAGLQNRLLLNNGKATYSDLYGSLVADVGNKTHQADITQQAQQTLLDQTMRTRASASGVNLDEEAANMMKYQQAYQAAAQVISTASNLFSTLLSMLQK